jgi:hypothetical protein
MTTPATTVRARVRAMTMSEKIEHIKEHELTPSERDVLTRDRERWKRVGGGAHLDEWLEFYPGLEIRRRLAMRIAFTNKPEGRGYATALHQLYEADGFNPDDKTMMTGFTAVLWLNDDPTRVEMLREIRAAMTPGERSRLNSPISARQRVEKMIKARASGSETKQKDSPIARAHRKIAELERELADTKAKLARVQDGSLFDLRHDNADDIGRVTADTISEGKFDRLAAAAKARYRAQKTRRAKPAG